MLGMYVMFFSKKEYFIVSGKDKQFPMYALNR